MYQIWYEQYSLKNSKFRSYKLRKDQSIQKYIFPKKLKDIVKYTDNYPKYKHIFMLDESRFSFFRVDIFENKEKIFTINDLQEIIKEKCDNQKKKYELTGDKLVSYIDSIYVNGEEKKYIFGEKGEIFFRLYNIYIDKTTTNIFNSVYGNVLKNKNINIIPQSFNTFMFLKNTLKKEDFLMMYIDDLNCKTIKIENNFYKSIETINLGLNSLKKMYKDNDIQKYWNENYDNIEGNSLAKILVIRTIEFYVKMLCKRLNDKNIIGTDIIIISPIIKNGHFIDVFNKEYAKYTNNYIVPFHKSEKLNYFNEDRDANDTDILTYINKNKLVK